MASGIEMMLKAAGIDPQKMVADFVQLKDVVTKTMTSLDERMARMEKMQGEIWQKITQPQQPMPAQPQPTVPQAPRHPPEMQPLNPHKPQ